MAVKKAGGIVVDLVANTQKFISGMNKAKDATNKAVKSIKGAVGGLAIGAAFASATKAGFSYNKIIEEQTQSITALIAATSKAEDAQGNAITNTELYTRANAEAVAVLKELEIINKSTPNTLGETAQIYKTMLPSMKALGVGTDDLVQITKQLSIAAGAGGIQFNSLLAGVDGLATGAVLANSDLGRFLSTIGLSNEELKNTDDIVGLLNDQLGSFEAPDTMAVAISNLENAWGKLTGVLTEDAFLGAKNGVNGLSEVITSFTNDLEPAFITIVALSSKITDGFTLIAAVGRAAFAGLTQGVALGFNTMLASVQGAIASFVYSLRDLPVVGDNMKALAISLNTSANLTLENARKNKSALNEERDAVLAAKAAYDKSIYSRITLVDGYIQKQKESGKVAATITKDVKVSAKDLAALEKDQITRTEAIIASKNRLRSSFESIRDSYDSEGAGIRLVVSDMSKLESQLRNNIITQDEYNQTVKNMGDSYNQAQLDASKVTTQMEDDISQLADSISSQLEGAMTQTFRSWLDGARNFSDLFKSLIKDIAAELFRVLVIQNLIRGVTSSFTGTGFATGGAFDGNGNVTAYASGGVVNSPTYFPMNSGTGLMGEAGPEAIMPLTRVGGDLGVKVETTPVNVNVINNGNDQVRIEQDGNAINVLIETVENSISSGLVRGTGSLGGALSQMKQQGRL